jgi:hypothetical protein
MKANSLHCRANLLCSFCAAYEEKTNMGKTAAGLL